MPTLVDAYVFLCRTACTDLDRAHLEDEYLVGLVQAEEENVLDCARFPPGDEIERGGDWVKAKMTSNCIAKALPTVSRVSVLLAHASLLISCGR